MTGASCCPGMSVPRHALPAAGVLSGAATASYPAGGQQKNTTLAFAVNRGRDGGLHQGGAAERAIFPKPHNLSRDPSST